MISSSLEFSNETLGLMHQIQNDTNWTKIKKHYFSMQELKNKKDAGEENNDYLPGSLKYSSYTRN